MKKLLPLLFCAPILVASCSLFGEDNRTALAGNIDTYLSEEKNNYLAPSINEITANLRINANFAIYFTTEGCSSCEEFSPIMDNYISGHNLMVYKFDSEKNREELNEFTSLYGEKFSMDTYLSLPALCIIKNGEPNYVNRDSYMKTQNAFNNFMNSHYKVGNVFYTSGNVFDKEFVNREFAYVYFDFNNDPNLSLYKTKLDEKVKSSSRKVIVSNYAEDSNIHLKLCGRSKMGTYSRLEYVVTNETSDEVISTVL